MRQMNSKMEKLLSSLPDKCVLHPYFSQVVDEGFILENGCLFLKRLRAERMPPSLKHVGDETGVEVFVNSLHTDDYVSNGHVEQAIKLSTELESKWRRHYGTVNSVKPIIVIAGTEFGMNIKLFNKREEHPYLTNDLESYEQPILQVEFE